MKKNYNIISSTDEEFARAVAFRVIVTKPVSVWQTLIPFIFISDFLKRSNAMRLYTENFMFPRKQAIDAVFDINNGEDKDNRLSRVEKAVREWLNSSKLYSRGLHRKMLSENEEVPNHFSRPEVLEILKDYYAGLEEKVEVKLHKYAEGEK